jgi:hypothetical protein
MEYFLYFSSCVRKKVWGPLACGIGSLRDKMTNSHAKSSEFEIFFLLLLVGWDLDLAPDDR